MFLHYCYLAHCSAFWNFFFLPEPAALLLDEPTCRHSTLRPNFLIQAQGASEVRTRRGDGNWKVADSHDDSLLHHGITCTMNGCTAATLRLPRSLWTQHDSVFRLTAASNRPKKVEGGRDIHDWLWSDNSHACKHLSPIQTWKSNWPG